MKLTNIIPASPTCDLVEIENGQAVTDSVKVAEVFGKLHKNVIRDIQEKILPNVSTDFGQLNFEPSTYVNEQNKVQPMYRMTRDGFTMVAMGYTGAKAMQFKEAYINAFNVYEAEANRLRPNSEDLIEQAATKITSKLFPQFVKTVSSTLSKDIVERIRSLPQGEQLLQIPQAVEPTESVVPVKKPQRETITLYIVIAWDDKEGTQVYKTKNHDHFIALLREIIAQGKQYTVERIKTTSYK